MKEELFPLIYIASSDEAGSALLERLIGAHPAIWSLGELRHLPRARHAQQACGCGSELAGCPYWSRAFAELDPRLEVAVEGLASRRKPLLARVGEVSDLLLGASSPRRIEEAQAHGVQSRAVLESFRRTAQAFRPMPVSWILDCSRDARRLLWLKDSRRFDLRVLHVVRDPRADVHAHLQASGVLTRRSAAVHAARWAFENLLLWRLASSGFRKDHVLRIRREELVQEPAAVLERVGKLVGLTFPAITTRLPAQLRMRTHAISLGGARLLEQALLPPEQWREELPRELADTAWRLTWPVRAALGYARP